MRCVLAVFADRLLPTIAGLLVKTMLPSRCITLRCVRSILAALLPNRRCAHEDRNISVSCRPPSLCHAMCPVNTLIRAVAYSRAALGYLSSARLCRGADSTHCYVPAQTPRMRCGAWSILPFAISCLGVAKAHDCLFFFCQDGTESFHFFARCSQARRFTGCRAHPSGGGGADLHRVPSAPRRVGPGQLPTKLSQYYAAVLS